MKRPNKNESLKTNQF